MVLFAAILATAQVPPRHKAPVFAGNSLKLVKAMEAAFGKLNDEVVTIYSETGKTTVELLGKKIREEQANVVWAFDGTRLYVRDKKKHIFYSGKCLRHRAVEVVSMLTHNRVDTFTRSLLFHRIPFEDGFLDAKVAVLGTAAPHGIVCDIIESNAPAGQMSIFLHRRDHLPQSVSTATYEAGKIISSTDRSYGYAKLTAPRFVLTPLPGDKLGRFPYLPKEKI